jgi:thymidylate synthase (FAD)
MRRRGGVKIIEPSYEILDCPDGEECLAKLERIARVAYKSEDKMVEEMRHEQG